MADRDALAELGADRLGGLAVALAALVPVEAPVATRPAWLQALPGRCPVTALDLDNGEIVDLVAVDRVLNGHLVPLTRAEKRAVVCIGTRAGMSAKDLAALLDIDKRSVVRYRRDLRSGTLTAPAPPWRHADAPLELIDDTEAQASPGPRHNCTSQRG